MRSEHPPKLTANHIRTTTFKLSPETCGSVHLYRLSPKGRDLWQSARQAYAQSLARDSGRTQLPYGSLSTALTVLSEDFVQVNPAWLSSEGVLILSRKPLDHAMLWRALFNWQEQALKLSLGLEDLVEELSAEKVQLWELRPGSGQKAPGWWWEAAKWEVAHRLCQQRLRVDGRELQLRPDSQASLLTWDDLIEGKASSKRRDPAQAPLPKPRAMHRLVLHPLLMPGWEEPFISVVPTVSRLDGRLGPWVRNVWVEAGKNRPLLRESMRTGREWALNTGWRETTARVLDESMRELLPEVNDDTVAEATQVRATPKHVRPGFPIGKGPGQKFFDAVAHHVRRCIPELEPLILPKSASIPYRPGDDESKPNLLQALGEQGQPVRVVVLYHHAQTRAHLALGLAQVLEPQPKDREQESEGPSETGTKLLALLNTLPDDQVLVWLGPGQWEMEAPHDETSGAMTGLAAHSDERSAPRLELVFRHPYRSELLCEAVEEKEFDERLKTWLTRDRLEDRRVLGLVETVPSGKLDGVKDTVWKTKRTQRPLKDPKFLVRQQLVTRGIVTQFVTLPEDSSRKKSESRLLQAEAAVLDLFRGAGIFPWRIEGKALKLSPETWYVGITAVQKQSENRHPADWEKSLALALVATRVGSRTALTWRPDKYWCSLAEGTTDFHKDIQLLTMKKAPQALEEALTSFLTETCGPVILFVDGQALRRLWPFLQESQLEKVIPAYLPPERVAIVRCRLGRSELPSIAGRGEWRDEALPNVSSSLTALLANPRAENCRTWYYAGTSVVQGQNGPHRVHSRFGLVDQDEQRNEWHAFTVREFQVV